MINVTVFSGGRADWGLLSPVCRALEDDAMFNLRIIVTGQHLMEGATSTQAIEDEGFEIASYIDMGLDGDDSAVAITRALARGIYGFAEELYANRPDLVLILGDRYEILGVVQAALIAKIPVAHICGGDVTEGAMDDSIRHAITKIAQIHFVTNNDSKSRVEQMGEDPSNVHCVGNPGLDHIHTMKKMSREAFFQSIEFTPHKKNVLVTFHPITLDSNSIEQCQAMLDALAMLGDDVGIILTGSNADPEGAEITAMVKKFAAQHKNACFHESLGSARYLNALSYVDVMVGNSSSGLYEAPSFGLPTVNIGDRQKGRLRAPSIIDCASHHDDIYAALEKALGHSRGEDQNPYGDGHSAERILKILKQIDYSQEIHRKKFIDIEKKQ